MIIHACAPNRILDFGSWTDTPFAEYGAALNCAVGIYSHVTLRQHARRGVLLRVNGTTALLTPAQRAELVSEEFLHAIARYFEVDGFEVQVHTDAPADAGLGTSASVGVALTAAVAEFAGSTADPDRIAAIAHYVQCEELGRTCGLQCYLAAALGGSALYRIEPYPRFFATPLPEKTLDGLERRLLLVQTGRAPAPNLFAEVGRRFQRGDRRSRVVLWQLRALPVRAYDALAAGDFATLGAVMNEQANLQQQLCPSLSSPEARRARSVAREFGVTAGKTNGSGGSLTLLCPPDARQPLMNALRRNGYDTSPVRIERSGVQVWTEADTRLATALPALVEPITPERWRRTAAAGADRKHPLHARHPGQSSRG
ncbi:MAG: GHMP family kinase ATP-binding protein [Armatimonadota bacterium]